MTHWSNALLDSRHPRTLQLHPLHMTRHPEWKPNGFIYIKRHEGSRLLSIVPYVQHCSPAVHFRLFSPRPPMTHINLQKCDGLRRPSDERVNSYRDEIRTLWEVPAWHMPYTLSSDVCVSMQCMQTSAFCFLSLYLYRNLKFSIFFPHLEVWCESRRSAQLLWEVAHSDRSLIRLDGTAGRRQATGEP